MIEPQSSVPTAPPRDLKRWLVIALVISVAFNLFALGFVAARALRPHHGHEGHGPFMGPRGLMREGFGPHARPMLDKVMERHGDELRKARGELKRSRREVRDALLAEPFDAPRLERALAGLRAHTDGTQAHMHEALVELASSLPLEQRKHLARRALAFEATGMGGRAQGGP
jgi:uncharacterized membrane protein